MSECSVSVVVVTYRRLKNLEKILQAWCDQSNDVWLVDCSDSFETDLPVHHVKMTPDPGNPARHAISLLTKGDYVIKADDDVLPEPGFVDDFLKYSFLDGVLGVMGRVFHGPKYYKNTSAFKSRNIEDVKKVDMVGIVTFSPRKYLAFDLQGCESNNEDLFWHMKAYPDVKKYVIPTTKYKQLPESKDKEGLYRNSEAKKLRNDFYKKYYNENYKKTENQGEANGIIPLISTSFINNELGKKTCTWECGQKTSSLLKIPIFIITHDRLTCLKESIKSYYRNMKTPFEIVICDMHSSNSDLISYLKEMEKEGVKVYWSKENYWRHSIDEIIDSYYDGPEDRSPYFVVTDPDIEIDESDGNILEFYKLLIEETGANCVGPQLRIDDIPDHYPLKKKCIKYNERIFWKENSETINYNGNEIKYIESKIDSTFALYKKGYKKVSKVKSGIRVYPPYSARHSDWYLDLDNLEQDQIEYMMNSKMIEKNKGPHWGGVWLRNSQSIESKVFLLSNIGGDHLDIVPHFLKYYKGMVDDYLIVAHCTSKENKKKIMGWLNEYKIEKYDIWEGKWSPKEKGIRMNALIDIWCRDDDWILRADQDEFCHLPQNINVFLRTCESENFKYVIGEWVDRCGFNGELVKINDSDDIFKQFPISCDIGHDIGKKHSKSCKKVVLSKKHIKMSNSGFHRVSVKHNGLKKYPEEIVINHFKWDYYSYEKMQNRVNDESISGIDRCESRNVCKEIRTIESKRFFKSMMLRDKCKGRRCFIIASGPSVNDMDLSFLKDEITIGVNQSYRNMLDEYGFVANYYCANDARAYHVVKDDYAKFYDSGIIFPKSFKKFNYKGDNCLLYVNDLKGRIPNGNYNHHLEKGAFRGAGTVMLGIALPFAMFLGCNPIYFIGFDNNHKGHFYSAKNRLAIGKVNKSINVAYRYAVDNGFELFNAGMGGDLPVVPRCDYKSLFDDSRKFNDSCWVLSGERTGSTYLCSLLNNTGLFDGIFNENMNPDMNKELNQLVFKVDNFRKIKNQKKRRELSLDYIKSNEIPKLNKIHRSEFRGRFGLEDEDSKLIAEKFENIKYILIQRKDMIARATSWYVKMETKTLHVSSDKKMEEFQKKEIEMNDKKLLKCYNIMNSKFQKYGCWDNYLTGEDFIRVDYDDLSDNPVSVLRSILLFLGFDVTDAFCENVLLMTKNKKMRHKDSDKVYDRIKNIKKQDGNLINQNCFR